MPRPRRFLLANQDQAFRPTQVSGLLAWWDAADVSTLFTGTYADRLTSVVNPSANLDPLCRLEDKSGLGNHLTCNADATRPTFALTATLNGRTGSNLGRWDRPVFANGSKTWFIVHKWDGTNADTRLCTNSQTFTSLGISSSASWQLSFVRDNVAWVASGFATGTSARIYRVQYHSGVSSYWTVSATVETGRQDLGATGNTPPSAGFINMPGQLYEVMVYSRVISGDDLTAVHAYLSAKWGI